MVRAADFGAEGHISFHKLGTTKCIANACGDRLTIIPVRESRK
jgi:hypothetical protein